MLIALIVVAVISGIMLAIPATRKVCIAFWGLFWSAIGVFLTLVYGLCALIWGICVFLFVPAVVIGGLYVLGHLYFHHWHW